MNSDVVPFVEDIAWCWWTKPRATRIGSVLYLGALDTAGRIVAVTWDLATRQSQRCVLAQFEPDDHNNPALVAEPGRRLVAFYSRHQEDDALRFRVSTRPQDITEWGEERVLRFGGQTTYAQVHARGDELHLFTRVDNEVWGYARSGDWGTTWSEPRQFMRLTTDQEVYMPTVSLPDGRTVRVAVSGHPKEWRSMPLHDVWVCEVDLSTGSITRPSDGVRIGDLFSGEGLPLDQDRLEPACQTPPDRTVNLFDVSDGPVFEVGFVSKVKDDNSTTDARYHVASLRDGRWLTEEVVAAGRKFGYIDAGFYAGGVAFPAGTPGGRVFTAREAENLWYLERWDRDETGRWSGRPLLGPTPTRLARPWPVSDPAAGLEVLALALDRYGDSYFDTLSHLVGAGEPGCYRA